MDDPRNFRKCSECKKEQPFGGSLLTLTEDMHGNLVTLCSDCFADLIIERSEAKKVVPLKPKVSK